MTPLQGDDHVRHDRFCQAGGRASSSRRDSARGGGTAGSQRFRWPPGWCCGADSAACRPPERQPRGSVAAPELPRTRRASWRGAMRPPSYQARALGVGTSRSCREHRTPRLRDDHERGAHIPRDGPRRRPAVAGLRPGTSRHPGLGCQSAAAGTGRPRHRRRERPGAAAGRCHQRAVGLVLPRPATRHRCPRPGREGCLGGRAVNHLDSGQERETAVATLTQVRETTQFLEAGSRSRMLAAEAVEVMPGSPGRRSAASRMPR
jgi:hypothetical protein